MKSYYLFLTLFTWLTFDSFSQDSFSFKKIGIGIRQGIGYNFLDYSGASISDPSGKASWMNPAIILEYRPHRYLCIQSEFQYYSAGFTESIRDTTLTSTLNFIGFNLLAKLRMNDDDDKHTLYALAGPSFGYFLNGNVRSSVSKGEVSIDRTKLTSIALSGIVGMGYSYRTGQFDFHSDIRANMGINSINKFGSNKLRLNQFSLNIGMLYFF